MSKTIPPALFERFDALCCRLSPENVCGDGEYPRAYVRKLHSAIMREWAALEREAGRKVTQEEIETVQIARWRAEDAARFSTVKEREASYVPAGE